MGEGEGYVWGRMPFYRRAQETLLSVSLECISACDVQGVRSGLLGIEGILLTDVLAPHGPAL